MNPSPSCIAYIRDRSPDWSRSDAEIAAGLNAATAPNPIEAAPPVPAPFTVGQVFGLLSPGSVAKLATVAFLPDVRDKIQANDRAGCGLYVSLLAGGSIIAPSEAQALQGLLSATVPDPSWTATLPAPLVALGRALDADDVAASRPGS